MGLASSKYCGFCTSRGTPELTTTTISSLEPPTLQSSVRELSQRRIAKMQVGAKGLSYGVEMYLDAVEDEMLLSHTFIFAKHGSQDKTVFQVREIKHIMGVDATTFCINTTGLTATGQRDPKKSCSYQISFQSSKERTTVLYNLQFLVKQAIAQKAQEGKVGAGRDVPRLPIASVRDAKKDVVPSAGDAKGEVAPSGGDVKEEVVGGAKEEVAPSGGDVKEEVVGDAKEEVVGGATEEVAPIVGNAKKDVVPSGGDTKDEAVPSDGDAKKKVAPSGGEAKEEVAPSGGESKEEVAPRGGDAQGCAQVSRSELPPKDSAEETEKLGA